MYEELAALKDLSDLHLERVYLEDPAELACFACISGLTRLKLQQLVFDAFVDGAVDSIPLSAVNALSALSGLQQLSIDLCNGRELKVT